MAEREYRIGQEHKMEYVKMINNHMQFHDLKKFKLLARGKSMNTAIDVALILKGFGEKQNIGFLKFKEPITKIFSQEVNKEDKHFIISCIEIQMEMGE